MRVIDYKDGIKGEAPRLLAMCMKEYCLTRHYEYEKSEHVQIDFSYLFGPELMDTVTHFPEIYMYEIQRPVYGLVDCMVFLGNVFDCLPIAANHFYNSLRLIRVCDGLESLLSFRLADKERDSDAVLNEVQFLTASIITGTEALLQEDSQLYLLERRCTILDFVILGLYVACCDQDQLRELVACRMEQSPRLGTYLQRQVKLLLPVLIRYGQHMVCHASGPYATLYWLLMSQARLPFKIVPSSQPYLQILHFEHTDMNVALRTIAGVLGFDTSDESPLLQAVQELWTTAPGHWASTKKLQLGIVDKYFQTLANKQLQWCDKARLDELYCIRLIRDSDVETTSCLLPSLYHYAHKWLAFFTRKENCLLLLSNMEKESKPVDFPSLLYETITFPFEMVDVLNNLGYHVHVLILSLTNYQERIAQIKERFDYREGRLDIFNACDGTEFEGCIGVSAYKALEELQIKYAGCNIESLNTTTSKDVMKAIYREAGVPTAPYVVMSPGDPPISTEHIPYPVLVKPCIAFASLGLTKDAKCHTTAELEAQLKKKDKEFIYGDKYVVESFIHGREFTVLVVGSGSTEVIAFDPAERVFVSSKDPKDRWLSREALLFEAFFEYKKVEDSELAERLKEISKQAHVALNCRGYTRTDLRQDAKTGAIYTLETNSPCGIGFEIAPYYILKMCGQRLEDFLAYVIATTMH